MESISFYSHHSIWGGFFSFVLGKIGHGGGFVINDIKPPESSLYTGYKKGNSTPRLLPFFSHKILNAEREIYQENKGNETAEWCHENTDVFEEEEIRRVMNWASESWKAGDMKMTIMTPFQHIKRIADLNKEEARFISCPALFIQLEFDNSTGNEEMTGIFALRDMRRLLSETTDSSLQGMAYKGIYGCAVNPDPDITEHLGWNIVENVFNNGEPLEKETGNNRIFRMGNEGGFSFHIPPGQKKTIVMALGVYVDGIVTTGKKAKLYYTEYFSSLDEVLEYALTHFDPYYELVKQRDMELASSPLNPFRQFIIAHATRSYLANTELLIDREKKTIFVVYEGEYQLMNTLDLVIDQVFWEIYFTPWTVENELEHYLHDYSYNDYVLYTDGRKKDFPICFCHDQGIDNMFSPRGYSAYEIPDLSGCFSYMTAEETLNWLITAALYGIRSNNKEWLKKHAPVFHQLLDAMIARDEDNDGIMDKDSSRCGTGSEITTYDSLDSSLGQAKKNLYLGVKTWAGYVCLENIFALLNEQTRAEKAGGMSRICASTISSYYNNTSGYIPAVFENTNTSRIIPAIEGLLYPYIIGDIDAVSPEGRFGDFIQTLQSHIEHVLVPGICINEDTKGWQLSSTSNNTWMSKIIINQYVAENILHISSDKWEEWDRIHASWQQCGCSVSMATDQIDCFTGQAIGSRVYPRLVTSLLWLKY